MKAHQLENGGIKYGIFTLWNIMKPFKRITAILTDLEGLPRDSPEREKMRKVCLGFHFGKQDQKSPFT